MLPKPPVLLLSAIALFVLVLAPDARSQSADGFTVQERAGIVLVKPQAWSKDVEATVVEFQAFTDRTASGAAGAGYIEFRTKGADRRQIPTPRIVKMVVYPDASLIKEVVTEKDRDGLDGVVTDLKATITRFPATRTYIEPALKKVTEEVATYDSGKVKTNGVWVDRSLYVSERARTFAAQIRPDIVKAEPPSSFDLPSDPRFLALQELAAGNPSVKPLVAELAGMYDKRVRAEKRTALLARVVDPNVTFADAKSAVTRLKALQPEEDPRSLLFLKNWDAAEAKVSGAVADGKTLAAALETEMAAFQSEDTLPEVSPDLDKKVAALTITLSGVSGKVSPALLTEVAQAEAVCAIVGGLGKLKVNFNERQYLAAKDVLDPLSAQSRLIGPQTTRVITGLQKIAAASIGEFSRLREEAKVQADANKPAEALATYQKAFAVIPDPGVGEQIALLKEKVPPKK